MSAKAEERAEPTDQEAVGAVEKSTDKRSADLLKWLGFRNIGAIYVWVAIIVIFSVWAPDTFPYWSTAQTILNQNAISGLVALALVVPLSARMFDLSVGSALGLCNVVAAWLLVERGTSVSVAIVLTILTGVAIGVVNAIVVVRFRIDSFIGTLATGSLLAAMITMLTDDVSIIGPELGGDFSKLAVSSVQGVAAPVLVMVVVGIVIWYLMSLTVTGRRIYATGFNEVGARLAGIRTKRLQALSLVTSGLLVGIGGVLLTAQISSGSPNIGPPYLLDAFAAAFLGATQFGGRFNAAGTVIAVLLLGTGKAGLVLVEAPIWAPSMFAGVVLLFALALTNVGRTAAT